VGSWHCTEKPFFPTIRSSLRLSPSSLLPCCSPPPMLTAACDDRRKKIQAFDRVGRNRGFGSSSISPPVPYRLRPGVSSIRPSPCTRPPVGSNPRFAPRWLGLEKGSLFEVFTFPSQPAQTTRPSPFPFRLLFASSSPTVPRSLPHPTQLLFKPALPPLPSQQPYNPNTFFSKMISTAFAALALPVLAAAAPFTKRATGRATYYDVCPGSLRFGWSP
jgi:hypothetical protein